MTIWNKVSLKGVIIGSVIDIVASNVWGLALGVYLVAKYQIGNLPVAERASQIHLLLQSQPTSILNMLVGGAFTILGGYIAARVAKRHELLNGTLASFLCVLFALFAIGSQPVDIILRNIIVSPFLGLAGGYLRLQQKT